jgi:Alr-MurF fusion protein
MGRIEYNPEVINTQSHYLLTDSRQVIFPEKSIFFAINGAHHDGHQFVQKLYEQGVREFVIEEGSFGGNLQNQIAKWPEGRVIVVHSSVRTLQKVATEHRRAFSIPVVGIAGSNGKTIVKEWLTQLMSAELAVVSSPKSYNSQIGVPLSVWNLKADHRLAIFEAGISQAHEMEFLQPVIQPTVGIFTNIGPAHDHGFKSRKQKITEKLRLFTKAKKLIYRKDYKELDEEISLILRPVNPFLRTLSWATGKCASDIQVRYLTSGSGTRIMLEGSLGSHTFETEFRDDASLENLTHCVVFLLDFGTPVAVVRSRIQLLRAVSMRLELKEGINHCYLIDDTYNNDVQGLTVALNFLLQQEQRNQKTVILSDVLQTGQVAGELYGSIAALLEEKGIDRLIGIGPDMQKHETLFQIADKRFFKDTSEFLSLFPFASLTDSLVLIKGARPFTFEKIVHRLQQKVHSTIFEINLDALIHNLNFYQSKVGSHTKIMAMVKAFAYGSGSTEIASLLQYHRVDYLGVAYADEGVSLRQNGIALPIMVMNASPATFDLLWQYNLEPELYSQRIFNSWQEYVASRNSEAGCPAVHLKFDTGMNRLGFTPDMLPWLLNELTASPAIKVASIFSHLVGADEGEHNAFSRIQYERFIEGATLIEAKLGYSVTKHILNSAGIIRFPEYKLDMVRLGIGLYGIEAARHEQRLLQTVGTLRTTVSQIKYLNAGETVGYGRKGQLESNAAIATLAIGYADGYDRGFGNGVGKVWVNGVLCPTIGNICMDMTMIDVTSALVAEGDEVIMFGKEISLSDLAASIGTIPYELLTGIGERVKRVFFKE